MDKADIVLEIANHLRTFRGKPDDVLVKFAEIAAAIVDDVTPEEVRDNFEEAASKAGLEVIDKTDTRATIRRESPGVTFRASPFDME